MHKQLDLVWSVPVKVFRDGEGLVGLGWVVATDGVGVVGGGEVIGNHMELIKWKGGWRYVWDNMLRWGGLVGHLYSTGNRRYRLLRHLGIIHCDWLLTARFVNHCIRVTSTYHSF